MIDEVEKWRKRTRKKGPYYILSRTSREYTSGFDQDKKSIRKSGWSYVVMWKYGDKVRIGTLHDGMYTRYGIGTLGVLTGESATGLWQISPGTITDEELVLMMELASGKIPSLPQLSIDDLKDLRP